MSYTAQLPPTVAIVSGNNQSAVVGQFTSQPFDAAVWDSTGTQPVVGTSLTFTVQSGGGQLATSTTGTLSNSITLTTDVDGSAKVFYKQPASAGVISQIVASSGGAQVTFSTTSVAPANPPSTPPALRAAMSSPTSITFTWGSSTPGSGGQAISGYYIYRNGTQLNGSPQLSTSFTDTGVSGGTGYTYTVKAVDSAGNLSTAATLSVAAPSSSTSGTFDVYTPNL